MSNENRVLPKVSFKGVFIFLLLMAAGLFIIPGPLKQIGLSEKASVFLAAGLSSSAGLSLILTKIDAKQEERPYFKIRILISIIVSFAASALVVFVF